MKTWIKYILKWLGIALGNCAMKYKKINDRMKTYGKNFKQLCVEKSFTCSFKYWKISSHCKNSARTETSE